MYVTLTGMVGGARHHLGPTSQNSVMKLSEKGFERRSERGIGRYIGAKIGRTVRCRGSVQLSFGCLQDFSDSFFTEFSEVERLISRFLGSCATPCKPFIRAPLQRPQNCPRRPPGSLLIPRHPRSRRRPQSRARGGGGSSSKPRSARG